MEKITAKEILKKRYLLIEDDRTCEAHTHLVVEAMIEYAKLKCKEQKEICSNIVKKNSECKEKCVTAMSFDVLTSPEPKFE